MWSGDQGRSKKMERMKKIKILVLSHISELLGGAERSMLDFLDDVSKKHDITPEFILREPIGSLADELKLRGWTYHPLSYTFWSDGRPPEKPEHIYNNAVQNARAITYMEDIIKKTKPELVLTNSVVCPWAALAAHYQGIPHVWFVREYGDLDHGRVFEIGRKSTLEDVGTLSELVVTNSLTLGQHIKKYVKSAKVTTLYTPFNIRAIQKRAQEKVSSPYKNKESLKLVITGNIAESKGHMEALEAVSQLTKEGHNVELCVIGKSGDPTYFKKLNTFVAENSLLKKIHFIGYKQNPLAYVSLADVGIMASRREAFGRVTFEYLVAGKPVIGAKSGATIEMVNNGKNGYLYQQGSPENLALKIKEYLKDSSKIQKHGNKSKEVAMKMMDGEYNSDVVFGKLLKVARSGAKAKNRPVNFTHQWIEYLQIADNVGALSAKRLVKIRMRQHLKALYIKINRIRK
ncbi:glycosyltransferase family 4 protein [soil metagenome]